MIYFEFVFPIPVVSSRNLIMANSKSNLEKILSESKFGLTMVQLRRKYRQTAGCDFETESGESLEMVLERMQDTVRCERSSWSDVLYFLRSSSRTDNELSVNRGRPEDGKAKKSLYSVEEEIEQLYEDGRGWHTICWNTLAGDTETNIQERFSKFGDVLDVRIDKGKTFLRYGSRIAAASALQEFGLLHHIEASRRPKTGKGSRTSGIVDLSTQADLSADKDLSASKDVSIDKDSLPQMDLSTAVKELSTRKNLLTTMDLSQKDLPRTDLSSGNVSKTIALSADPSTSNGDSMNFQLQALSLAKDGNGPDQFQIRGHSIDVYDGRCKHARLPCKNYPKCRPNCDFQHPMCPAGTQCEDRFCSYDHLHRTKKCHLCIREAEGGVSLRFVTTSCDHRRTPCSEFPNCPYGVKCSFLHPPCPDDGCAEFGKCPYEHRQHSKVCFVCLKIMKDNADKAAKETRNDGTKSIWNAETLSLKKNIPCRYDAKCWTPQCPYKHPLEWAKKACPWGAKCRREKCTFVHPPLGS